MKLPADDVIAWLMRSKLGQVLMVILRAFLALPLDLPSSVSVYFFGEATRGPNSWIPLRFKGRFVGFAILRLRETRCAKLVHFGGNDNMTTSLAPSPFVQLFTR